MDTISLLMMGCGIVTFAGLQVVPAYYGRYANQAPAWLGFIGQAIPAPRLTWILQEVPTVVAWFYFFGSQAIMVLSAGKQWPSPNLLLSLLFLLHYVHRTFIFPFRLSSPKPTTVLCFVLAFLFCVINGYMQCRALAVLHSYPASWFQKPRTILGLALFFTGLTLNIHSDNILFNLRKPGETGYKIPRGGLFEYVSGANFASEILEWTGFAIACWSMEAAAFALFTAFNIGPRAVHHHRWYKDKFGSDYPAHRRAVIPFIY